MTSWFKSSASTSTFVLRTRRPLPLPSAPLPCPPCPPRRHLLVRSGLSTNASLDWFQVLRSMRNLSRGSSRSFSARDLLDILLRPRRSGEPASLLRPHPCTRPIVSHTRSCLWFSNIPGFFGAPLPRRPLPGRQSHIARHRSLAVNSSRALLDSRVDDT